jgi:hypothetical protein
VVSKELTGQKTLSTAKSQQKPPLTNQKASNQDEATTPKRKKEKTMDKGPPDSKKGGGTLMVLRLAVLSEKKGASPHKAMSPIIHAPPPGSKSLKEPVLLTHPSCSASPS